MCPEYNLNLLYQDGFCHFPSAVSQSMLTDLDRATDKLIAEWKKASFNDARFWRCKGRDDSDVLYRIHEVETLLPQVPLLFDESAVQQVCKAVFGERWAPHVFALIYKEPFRGVEVPWHRDPVDAEPGTIFNFSFFLDPSALGNGGLEFVPGSHIDQTIGLVDGQPPSQRVTVPVHPGDVVIHDVRVLHGSGPNTSQQRRRSIVAEVRKAQG